MRFGKSTADLTASPKPTGSKPSVICAFGQDSRIEVASSSRLLPFDLNSMAFRTLLGARERGTSQVPNP